MSIRRRTPFARSAVVNDTSLSRGRPERFRPLAGYRGDKGKTIVTGVSQWDDLYGAAKHLVQAVGTKQPADVPTGGNNGRGAIAADGVDDFMRVTFTFSQPCSCYIVCKWNAAFAADDCMWDGSAGSRGRFYRTAATTLKIESPTTLSSTASTPTSFHYYTLNFSGAASQVIQDRTVLVTGDAGVGNPGGFNLFTYGGDSASNPCNGTIAELLAFGRVLSTSEDARLNNYTRAWHGFA